LRNLDRRQDRSTWGRVRRPAAAQRWGNSGGEVPAMMRLSQAAQALHASSSGRDVEFTGVSTDSRAIRSGELFVAIKGDRFDGHAFVEQAASRGAVAALVNKTESSVEKRAAALALPLIAVDDTLAALGSLAQHWRSRFAMPLVALTGSNGKTTVKEMLAAILREAALRERRIPNSASLVLATRGNLNNHVGMPLTLLELRYGHRFAVIEMGMNHAGEISYLTRLAQPDVALINNAGAAHIEFLGSVEAVARAKGEIFEGLKAEGVAVINADEPHAPMWRALARRCKQIEFGLTADAMVTATYRLRDADSEILLKTPLGETRALVPAPGLHNVRNALAASAAAIALNVPADTIAAGLARFPGVSGRLTRRRTAHGATLLDDTYNANPESMRAAIDILARCAAPTVLVLGDMGELGVASAALHREIGEYAASRNISRLFAVGEFMREAAAAFGANAVHAGSIEELIACVHNACGEGATVLVKGSRFMRMERVVSALAENREERGEKEEGQRQQGEQRLGRREGENR
jgi:UDP-N-acetylmuramoyl-tripeptide--D-alanyl-D-alanine ligase